MPVITAITEYQGSIGDVFVVQRTGAGPLPLKLERVLLHLDTPIQLAYSLIFSGPDELLPAGIQTLHHPRLGGFSLGLKPLQRLATGFEYEAVFNLLKESTGNNSKTTTVER